MAKLKYNIETLKRKIGKMIEQKRSFSEIYELNVELDKLIIEFYKTMEK